MGLRFEHVIDAPLERVFAFHANPANLAVLHGSTGTFRLLHHDGVLHAGGTVWFEQKVTAFLPVVLGFRHVVYEPPRRFADELVHGPFVRFVHVHEFEARADGTLVRDRLDVVVPWQYGGRLALRLVVAPRIRAAFAARHGALRARPLDAAA